MARRARRLRRFPRARSRRTEPGDARSLPDSEQAFEQAALAPLDGRRLARGRLARRLGVADTLLLLGRVDDHAGRRRILPEDQAVDERLVAVVDGLGVGVDPAAEVGVDVAAARL